MKYLVMLIVSINLLIEAYGHQNAFYQAEDHSQSAADVYTTQDSCVRWVVDQLLIPAGDTNRVAPSAHRILHADEMNDTLTNMFWEGATQSNVVSLAKHCKPLMTKPAYSRPEDIAVRKMMANKFRLNRGENDTGGMPSYTDLQPIPADASAKKKIRRRIRRIMGDDWGFVPHKMSNLGQQYLVLVERKETLGQDWHLDQEYVEDLYKFWKNVKRVLESRR